MIELETVVEKDYPYQAAGRTWTVRKLELTKLPTGKLGLSLAEIRRVNHAVANEICGSAEPLTFLDFEFLCATTSTTFKEAAEFLGIHRTTVTKWRRPDASIQPTYSLVLKKWFWFKLFGEQLADGIVPFHTVRNEADFLEFAKEAAIENQLATRIQTKVA